MCIRWIQPGGDALAFYLARVRGIRKGDLLFSVSLDTRTVVDFNATCDNWCLPAPWLKPTLGSGTRESRAQLQQEGATVRVSGHGSCNMKMNLNGLPQVAKMERVVEKLLVANRFSC